MIVHAKSHACMGLNRPNKRKVNEDPQKFAEDLRTAFPKADDATIDRLVGLAGGRR